MDHLLILSRINLPATWTEASTHLIVNAGPQPIRKLGVEAGPDGKDSSNQLQGLSKGGGRGKRTKVKGTIFLNPSDNAQGGKLLFHRKSEARIVFVIPQFYVIPRTVGFDQVVLQNEGFLFRIGDNGLDVRHLF